jgi:hypothetical protein
VRPSGLTDGILKELRVTATSLEEDDWLFDKQDNPSLPF